MDPILFYLRASGAALGATAIALAIAWFVRKRALSGKSEQEPRPRRWGAFALGAGVLGGFLALKGVPTLPCAEDSMRAHDRLFWALLAVGLLGLLPWRRALDAAVVLLPVLLVARFHDLGDAGSRTGLELGLLALAGRLLIGAGDGVMRSRSGPTGALQVGIVLGVVAAAIGASGSVIYAQWAGTLGIAFGLVTLVAWRDWDAGQLDGASALLLAGAFALMATEYSELDPRNAVLILGALPLSMLATRLWGERKQATIVGWLVLLVPMSAAVIRIALAFEGDPYADFP